MNEYPEENVATYLCSHSDEGFAQMLALYAWWICNNRASEFGPSFECHLKNCHAMDWNPIQGLVPWALVAQLQLQTVSGITGMEDKL